MFWAVREGRNSTGSQSVVAINVESIRLRDGWLKFTNMQYNSY